MVLFIFILFFLAIASAIVALNVRFAWVGIKQLLGKGVANKFRPTIAQRLWIRRYINNVPKERYRYLDSVAISKEISPILGIHSHDAYQLLNMELWRRGVRWK